jgi:predicted NBD/HSP70 family sugar kinase
VDNEVNMSVRGERWLGHGQDCQTFIALELGTGVGMGIVIGGEVHRGRAGAAGEVGFLPLGGDPFDQLSRQRGAYEQICCSEALMRRYVEAGGQARTIADLFRGAENGDGAARQALGDHARLVALGLSAIASVLDPEVVVLGGIIGAQPGLLEPVRHELDRLMLTPPRVETTALGNRATLMGAVATALSHAHEELFGEPTIPVPHEQPSLEPAAAPDGGTAP